MVSLDIPTQSMSSQCLASSEKEREGIIFVAADIVKYFDKEDIFDVMEEPYKSEVNPKMCRL